LEAIKVREALIALAHRAGSAQQMALFGEGNVSSKIDSDRFFVKASGTQLATLTESQLTMVDARPILAALDSDAADDNEVEALLLASRVEADALKPSVETLFHAWLLQLPGVEFVAHTHPIAVNQLLCSPRAKEFAECRLFPDQIVYCGAESVLIPYVDPGMVLARRIAKEVEAFLQRTGILPKTILLENHGMIALGKAATEVEAALLITEKSARVFVGSVAVGGPVFLPPHQVQRIAGRIDEHYRQRMMETIFTNNP